MTYITRLSFDIITEDEMSQRRQNRMAREARDAFLTITDPDQIGLVKEKDVEYDVAPPFGHTHKSDGNVFCQDGENSCYHRSMDMIHPTDNEND